MQEEPNLDWLPEQTKKHYLTRAINRCVSQEKSTTFWAKLVTTKRLDIGLALFLFSRVLTSAYKRRTWPISSHLGDTLGK